MKPLSVALCCTLFLARVSGYISLYKDTDEVVDLLDSNTTMLYNSDSLWLVQFYSHWCGHCQRFAPFWKEMARGISDWSPVVKIAAMNCAEQSCDKYQVTGTPTIRLFHPMTNSNQLSPAFYGFSIPVQNSQEYYHHTILYNLASAQSKGVESQVNLNTLRNAPSPEKTVLSRMFDSLSDKAEHIALIFEQEGKNSVGKKVILDTNKQSKLLPVFRVNVFDPSVRSWNLSANPTMVIVLRDGSVLEKVDGWGLPDDRRRFTNILKSYAGKLSLETESPQSSAPPTSTTTGNTVTVTEKMYPLVKDEVFMNDLEKALEYSIMKEIGMQPVLDQTKLKSLLSYTQTLIKFFPNMRNSVKNFLTRLRDWIKLKNLSEVTSTQYNEKVKELSEIYQPFAATPSNWTGCAGSQQRFRGYPCSLWTLFHALTVNAADKDEAFHNDGVSIVANTMIGYIGNFFSCRDCAEHFSSHVSQLGSLPHTPEQSILWLWTVHNRANLMLSGDQTEDPTRPKVQWPHAEHCPTCRSGKDSGTEVIKTNGEFWNKEEVLSYIRDVYKEDNLVKNVEIEIEIEIETEDIKQDTEDVEQNTEDVEQDWNPAQNETRSNQTTPFLNVAPDIRLKSYFLGVISMYFLLTVF